MSTPYALHPLSLRFQDEALEKAYRQDHFRTLTFFARVGGTLAILMYLMFGVLDAWIVADHKEVIWLIRAVVIVLLGIALVFTFSGAFRKYNQLSQMLAGFTGGMGIVVMTAVIPQQAGYFYYSGVGIAIVFFYVLVGLSFINALYTNLAVLVCYEFVIVTGDLPLPLILNNNFVLFGFSIVAATGGYVIERQRRYTFYQSLQMQALKEHADAANEAKSRFIASMSHELRTPLNAIIGYSDMLAEDASEQHNQQLAADLSSIRSAGRHLLRLINNVLDLAKIEAGKLALNPQPHVLADIMDNISFTAKPLAAKNNNTLEIITTDAPAKLVVDGLRLEQILINLIGNACKFTRDGNIRLEIRGEGDGTVFEVADTGIGMTPEQVNALFEEYHQANATIASEYGGTGLGLAITRQLVELMGGAITVSSSYGEGSSFRLTLPVAG